MLRVLHIVYNRRGRTVSAIVGSRRNDSSMGQAY